MHLQDETQEKIISSAMSLIMERGYSSTTTKDIALKAGVNECTIFRKFKGKKEIVLSAMELPEWNPCLSEEDFPYSGDVLSDLLSFSRTYMRKVTPRMVKVSIGLRTPELYPHTADSILKVPAVFKKVLTEYLDKMAGEGKIKEGDCESLAMMFLSMNFGFVFLHASFGTNLTQVEKEKYISNSVRVFANGIRKS